VAFIFNRPEDFADEAVEGLVAAYPQFLQRVNGGVVRAIKSSDGNVAVVIGGGTGHYPAFAGLVGLGLAAGAATGNVFASPSAQQVYSVAKAADAGSGVLLSYGNYAGDVLNFEQAALRLTAEGIHCRSVAVTDDVLSGEEGQESRRRGIAGGLVVYKVAGAAADAGLSLDEVTRLAEAANQHTRTIGIAFSGCTLPGASVPLFRVPDGMISIGMGVHGEPGISQAARMTADELAEMLVSTLTRRDSRALTGTRAAVIINGLGSVKYEELFLLYRSVAQQLRALAITPVRPEVGEFVTSFEMAGVSLTICPLTAELERYWMAPASAPAFCRVEVPHAVSYRSAGAKSPEAGVTAEPVERNPKPSTATRTAQRPASLVAEAFLVARDAIREHSDELGLLDAVAGDGDHGIGMERGISAAADAAQSSALAAAGAGTTLVWAGEAWANRAGGTSGALWGLALRTFGDFIGDDVEPTPQTMAGALAAVAAALAELGKASLGDKTMLDALIPFAETFADAVTRGDETHQAWAHASAIATRAAADTASLVPRIGRARLHGQKSLGIPDPGATSFALIVCAVIPTLEKGRHGGCE
jgi:D-erythrulose 4-kinase